MSGQVFDREWTVEPGFNAVGAETPLQALSQDASLDIFDDDTRDVLEASEPFALVLGQGFETADVSEGLVNAPCAALASTEQLRFLQSHGMHAIVMSRLHGTLAQNARALGVEIVIRDAGAARGPE